MKYIVYKTINQINQHEYIGIHKTINPDVFDSYLGCGSWANKKSTYKDESTPFKRALLKYGPTNFKRYTLYIYNSLDEAVSKEIELVNYDYIKLPYTYNVALGGFKGVPGKTIYQYDQNGILIKEWENYLDVIENCSISQSSLITAIKYKRYRSNSYWSYNKVDKLDLKYYTCNKEIPIYLYDINGNYLQQYNSITDFCITFNYLESNIERAIKRKFLINKMYYISKEYSTIFNTTKEKLTGTLYRYDIDGNYIDSFKTIKEAEQKLGTNLSGLTTSIYKDTTCKGYRWRRGSFTKKLEPLSVKRGISRKVDMYDLNMNLIKTYSSINQARKDYPGCQNVLDGVCKTSHGFIFKFHQC